MIINRGGQLTYPVGYPRPQQIQQPQPNQLPPNLLAGGAATNPPAAGMRPPTGTLQPGGGAAPTAYGSPLIGGPLQPPAQSSAGRMLPGAQQGAARGGVLNLPAMASPGNPTGAGNGTSIYNSALNGAAGSVGGLGNPVLFGGGYQRPTNASAPGGGVVSAGGGSAMLSRPGGYSAPNTGGQVAGGNANPNNIAQQLQDARNAANAANQQRYQQQLDLNQSGLQNQLGDQNASYGRMAQMPGQSAARQQQMLQNSRQDQLGAINSASTTLQNQAAQMGQSQAANTNSAYAGLLNQANSRAANTQGFVDSAYGNLANTANMGGAQSMGFLNHQNQNMQGLLGQYSNADYTREKQQTDEQLAQISQDMADRGLSSDTLDQSLKRGVYNDSALRQASISDRSLGRQVDAANNYTGEGLGVMGNTNQQRFAAGSAYANAGLGARQSADATATNIAGRGVDTSLSAQQNADQARLGLGQSYANQDINTRGDLNRAGLNVAADQGAREQALAGQYGQQRQATMDQSNNQRIGIIGARTDQGPQEGDYFSLLSQAGASGRGFGGAPTISNPQGGGHIAGGGLPTGASGSGGNGQSYNEGGGGFGGLGNVNSSYDPYAGGAYGGSELNSTYGMPQGTPNDPLNEAGPSQPPWWMAYTGDYAYPT